MRKILLFAMTSLKDACSSEYNTADNFTGLGLFSLTFNRQIKRPRRQEFPSLVPRLQWSCGAQITCRDIREVCHLVYAPSMELRTADNQANGTEQTSPLLQCGRSPQITSFWRISKALLTLVRPEGGLAYHTDALRCSQQNIEALS